ncbi:MAG: MarR family transcriptional regulator [Hyphomonadaceae bacterium]|nr:MarR family transcriptional regulator [Hyphomonadaceae bacterium]
MSRQLRLQAFMPYRLSIAANAVSKAIAAAYAERFDLSIPEWRLIAVLYEIGEGTQQDLVRATLMDKVAVSRAAHSLEARRLVERRADAEDGRARRLRLSVQGEALYARIAPTALEYEQRLLDRFGKAEVAALQNMLLRLADAANAMNEEEIA